MDIDPEDLETARRLCVHATAHAEAAHSASIAGQASDALALAYAAAEIDRHAARLQALAAAIAAVLESADDPR